MAFTRTDRGDEIIQPYGPVVVIEGQNGGTRTATASARLNHEWNLEGAARQNKDLTGLPDSCPSHRSPNLPPGDLPLEETDGSTPSVQHHHRRHFFDTGRPELVSTSLVDDLSNHVSPGTTEQDGPDRVAGVTIG
jgi:hypothetical protein